MAHYDFRTSCEAVRSACGPALARWIRNTRSSGRRLWYAMEVAGQRRAAAWLAVAAARQWPRDPALAFDLRRRAARCRAAASAQHWAATERH